MTFPKSPPAPVGTSSNGGRGRAPGAVGAGPRQRAKALRAADAGTVLRAALPAVFETLSAAQVAQVQRVLDAAVVDPEVEKEANAIYAKAHKQYGSLTVRDPALMRKADRVMQGYIRVRDADRRIRLDFKKLLASDALKPTTDNPDEAVYLQRIRNTLEAKGVWLRFAPKLVRDLEDPSRHIVDPRTFNVWLSLGHDGDAIPTASGRLTREALLGTTVLGAGYFTNVHQGGTQKKLEREVNRLQGQIEAGLQQHQALAKIRREAAVGVAEVSDLFGGASFPDQAIWNQPHKMLVRALELNVSGNVTGSQAYLVAAALVTRNSARLVAAYIDDSSSGVERAVTVLTVLKTAGEVAEVGLAVTGVVGVVRGGAAIAGGEAGAATARAASVDATAERFVQKYVAKNPGIAEELNSVRYVPQPKGSIGGRGIKPNQSTGGGTGFHKWP